MTSTRLNGCFVLRMASVMTSRVFVIVAGSFSCHESVNNANPGCDSAPTIGLDKTPPGPFKFAVPGAIQGKSVGFRGVDELPDLPTMI